MLTRQLLQNTSFPTRREGHDYSPPLTNAAGTEPICSKCSLDKGARCGGRLIFPEQQEEPGAMIPPSLLLVCPLVPTPFSSVSFPYFSTLDSFSNSTPDNITASN